MRILVVNGPNLNLLGQREPEIYGLQTLADIEVLIRNRADELGVDIEFFQSNHEGQLIDAIQEHSGWDGLIINAGALTHTSLAIPDAVTSTGILTVEVHITNVHAREEFRHRSFLSPIVWGQVIGFGYRGYIAALDLLHQRLTEGDME